MPAQSHYKMADRLAAAMATPAGRGARIVLGLVLIGVGLAFVAQPFGSIVAAVGLIPITAGVLNWCLIGPLLGAPLRGSIARQRCGR